MLQGRGERSGDDLEELGHAKAGRRGSRDEHGEEVAAGHGPFQVGNYRFGGDLLAGEEALQQVLVLGLGHDPLEQPAAGVRDEVEVLRFGVPVDAEPVGVVADPLGQQADESRDVSVVGVHRQVEGMNTGAFAEHGPTRLEGALDIRAILIRFRHHDGARHALRRALVPQHRRRGVHAIHGRDDK